MARAVARLWSARKAKYETRRSSPLLGVVALGPLATVERSGASWSASPSARSRTCQRAILRDQGSSAAGFSKNRYAV